MCEPKDEVWLNHFYSRIMNQTDPLSMYHKARSITSNSRSRTQTSHECSPQQTDISNHQPKQKRHYLGMILWIIIVLILFFWFSNK